MAGLFYTKVLIFYFCHLQTFVHIIPSSNSLRYTMKYKKSPVFINMTLLHRRIFNPWKLVPDQPGTPGCNQYKMFSMFTTSKFLPCYDQNSCQLKRNDSQPEGAVKTSDAVIFQMASLNVFNWAAAGWKSADFAAQDWHISAAEASSSSQKDWTTRSTSALVLLKTD